MDGLMPVMAMMALLLSQLICLGGATIPYVKSPPDPTCFPAVLVRRNTVLKVVKMTPLKMNCRVKYCEEEPTVSWCRLENVADCKKVAKDSNVKIWQEQHEKHLIISYMEIKITTNNYSGEYKCQASEGSLNVGLSHSINVTVMDRVENQTENTDGSSSTESHNPDSTPAWVSFVIICVSIVTVVALVMLVSFLSLHRCKRSSRMYATKPKGSSQAQKTEHTVQDQHPIRKPSGHITPSPIVPKRDRSLRLNPTQSPALRHHPAHHPSLNGTSLQGLLTLPRAPASIHPDADHRSATMPNGSPGNASDRRPSQVLYATLDHLAPKDNSRTQPPKFHPGEEFSEYASIRVS